MVYVKVLAVIALLGSIAWFIASPGFETALAVVGSISALVSAFIVERRTIKPPTQRQFVSKGSIGIQAGGDVNIGDLGEKKDVR